MYTQLECLKFAFHEERVAVTNCDNTLKNFL